MKYMPVILLTGEAGVGKTTIIKRVLERTPFKAGGFITNEIRQQGRRVGFEIVSLRGERGVLAHVDFKSRYWVGKYFVNLRDLHRVGVNALERAMVEDDLVVIDEIGRMELFSKKFKDIVAKLLDGSKPVLGAIMSQRHPFAERIKQLPFIKIYEITKVNRDMMVEEVRRQLISGGM